MMTDTEHLRQIALLCDALRDELEELAPDTTADTWDNYLDATRIVAQVWHHLEELIHPKRDDRGPF